MNVEKYLAECSRMARLKLQDENVAKVYADVNFVKLMDKCNEELLHQRDLKFAEALFKNVSQSRYAAEPHPSRPGK